MCASHIVYQAHCVPVSVFLCGLHPLPCVPVPLCIKPILFPVSVFLSGHHPLPCVPVPLGIKPILSQCQFKRAHLHVMGMLRFMFFNIFFLYKNQPSLPTPFYSVLVSISVFVALSTVFQSTNSPNNSPLSHSVLPVLFLPCRSFLLYISFMKASLSPYIILCG